MVIDLTKPEVRDELRPIVEAAIAWWSWGE